MIGFIKKYFFKDTFLLYSYYLNILFFILDLLPHFLRNIIFKLCFNKYGKNTMIDYKTFFRYMKHIEINDHVSINRGCEFFTSANLNHKIILEENVVLSPYVKLYSAGHDYKYLSLPDSAGNIIIRKNTWIGANCIILQNVEIGEGSIIGANSIVTKDIPPFSVVMGTPATVVKQREIYES